jgi:hypothetical protein
MGPAWLPAGLLLAALLNAVVSEILDVAPTFGTRFGFNIWAALIVAVVIAGAIFAGLLVTMRRLNTAVAQS